MSIPVQCPACQHAFAVADRFAGKKGKCPKCGMIFKADAPSSGHLSGEIDVFPEVQATTTTPAVPVPKRVASRTPGAFPSAPPLSDSGTVDTFPTVPMGVPVTPAAPAQPMFSISSSDSGEHRLGKHKAKASPLPLIIGGSIAGLALVGIVIGVVWSLQGGDEKPVAKTDTETEVTSEAPPTPTNVTPAPPVTPTLSFDVSALAPLRERVLTLEIKSAASTSRASCFLAAERGYAVAPWNVLEQATNVEAITADGVRVPVSGTAAINVGQNLAIIKLEPTLPISLDPLEFANADPANNGDIGAIDVGGTTPGMAGKWKSTDSYSRLSPSMRAKLKNVQDEWADDTGIVLHSLQLSTEGIGSPLLTPEGRVVAMHMTNDSGSSLAVHARHIKTLLESAGKDIKPFGGDPVATAEPMPTNPTPTPEVKPLPDPPKPRPEDPIDDLIARIKEHQAACDKEGWTADDATEYAQFQLLAKFIHEAATLSDINDTPAEVKEKLQTAVREAMFSLTAEKWPSEAAWNKTNEHATKALETPGEGVFLLARVVVPTSQGTMLNDTPVALAEIVGQAKMILLPLSSGGEKLPLDTQVLVLGVHDPMIRAQYGGDANVPCVRTKYVLNVQKQD